MKPIINMIFAMLISINILAQQPFNTENAVLKSEFIYSAKDVQFPSCHASTIVETDNGLLTAWFGGTAEKNPDVGIWTSTFKNGKWLVPVEVANGIQHKNLRYPTWNPVLYNTGKEIMLFFKVGPNCSDWWGEVITSADNGKTWTNRHRLPEGIWGPIKNKPVKLSNGDLLCPSSTEIDGWRVHMEITPDLGKTWERTAALNDAKKEGAIQPTILVHKNDKLQILNRSKTKMILTSWSTDNGRTWSEFTESQLPNNNSGIDGVTLKDGRHILIYNHIKPDKTWGDRNILNLAISEDGINWKAAVLLENDQDKDTEYSYPAVIQTNDGMIHITYTWNRKLIKHVVIDSSKIKTKPIVGGVWPTL
jgi:predicted neuraminidase